MRIVQRLAAVMGLENVMETVNKATRWTALQSCALQVSIHNLIL
jgi:hypothetical protein